MHSYQATRAIVALLLVVLFLVCGYGWLALCGLLRTLRRYLVPLLLLGALVGCGCDTACRAPAHGGAYTEFHTDDGLQCITTAYGLSCNWERYNHGR